jgi:ATP-dependent Clp protease ATP-binding subunit ClpA
MQYVIYITIHYRRENVISKAIFAIIIAINHLTTRALSMGQDRLLLIDKMNNLYGEIKKDIIGQDIPLRNICNQVEEAELDLVDKERPKGTFIFMGPTGVGKTETCKALSKYLYGSADKLYRIDMPGYKLIDSMTKLIGDDTGKLGELGNLLKSDDGSGGIILLDEFEKGHPEIVDICLSMLDDAVVTCGAGTRFNLEKFYIVFTTNVGSKEIIKAGSGRGRVSSRMMENLIYSAFINAGYRPEFLKRFDHVINFNFIKPEDAKKIAKLNLDKESKRIGEKIESELDYTEQVLTHAQLVGYNRNFGARPLKNKIQQFSQRAAAVHILNKEDVKFGQIALEDNAVKIKERKSKTI